MTPAEVFWATFALMLLVTRLVADYMRIRLHVKGIHIHHFVWGILSLFISFAALYFDRHSILLYVAMIGGGTGAALIASEAKELVLQKWGR